MSFLIFLQVTIGGKKPKTKMCNVFGGSKLNKSSYKLDIEKKSSGEKKKKIL